jgi:Protein of unknown function (DUF1761)
MRMEIPINYLAVLLSGVAGVAIGAVWYGPLFGKQWMHMTGITQEGMKAMALTPLVAMIGGLITALLMAYVLAHGIVFTNAYMGTMGIGGGMTAAFWYWLGFVVPLTAGGFLWEGKPWKLWALHASYYLVSLLVMGAILGGLSA